MQSGRKKDVIHQAVLDRLLSRQYRFGDAVSVRELAELCGVSRQPIMTALSALAADGFLTVTAQVGCSVVSPSLQEMGDFFLMFGRFEGLLSELAATRGTPRQVADIEAINQRIAALDLDDAQTGERYRLLNREFHVAIHAMAQSPVLRQRQSALFNISDFYSVQTCGFRRYIAGAAAEHDGIIAALRKHDPKAAVRAAQAHIGQVRAAILRGQEEAGLS
jgi:DNA-binding GntR family transcriptional regulator